MKGNKGCGSKHIDDKVLYQAFINVFDALLENKDYFLEKWQERLESENLLQRYKAKQYIKLIEARGAIKEFDIELYFALVEKFTLFPAKRIIVKLLDGSEVECITE